MKEIIQAILTLIIGALVAVLFLMITMPMAMLWAVVLGDLWRWFVMPLGAPAIGFWNMMGLMLFSIYIRHGLAISRPDEDEGDAWKRFLHSLSTSILTALAAWLLGAIYHHFMVG